MVLTDFLFQMLFLKSLSRWYKRRFSNNRFCKEQNKLNEDGEMLIGWRKGLFERAFFLWALIGWSTYSPTIFCRAPSPVYFDRVRFWDLLIIFRPYFKQKRLTLIVYNVAKAGEKLDLCWTKISRRLNGCNQGGEKGKSKIFFNLRWDCIIDLKRNL